MSISNKQKVITLLKRVRQETLPNGEMINSMRSFEDGDYVVVYCIYNSGGRRIDIFRLEDGLIVEHWDNLPPKEEPEENKKIALIISIIFLYIGSGFILKNVFAYMLDGFSQYADILAGLIAGGFYHITSFLRYTATHLLPIQATLWLGIADTLLIGMCVAAQFRYKADADL